MTCRAGVPATVSRVPEDLYLVPTSPPALIWTGAHDKDASST